MKHVALLLLLALPCAADDAFQSAEREVSRLLREEPENLEAQGKALSVLKAIAPETAKSEVEELENAVHQRNHDVSAALDALITIQGAVEKYRAGKDAAAADVSWRKAVKKLRDVFWVGKRQEEWFDAIVPLLQDLRDDAKAEREKKEPDWTRIALALRLAGDISARTPPERFPAADAQALARDRDEAMERLYLETKWADAIPAKDMLAEGVEWKQDEWIDAERKDGTLTVSNSADKPGLFWLNQEVGWEDYILDLQFTCNDKAFQVFQRFQGEQQAAATHDFSIILAQGGFKAEEKSPRFGLMIFGGKNQVLLDGKRAHARPQRCAPAGARSGGFAFRLPPGAKVVLHALSVKVLREE